jgi:glycosyltransferase involved in cell wall biosynthesis
MNTSVLNKPHLIVLMPTYNVEKYVSMAIESILDQSHQAFIFLILDDGSTDSTIDIVEHYAHRDERIVFIKNKDNEGIIESRNKLFDLCKDKYSDHEYIALMDSDDISHPERFSKQLSFFKNNPQYKLLASNIKVIPYNTYADLSDVNGKIKEKMIFINVINNPSSMLHASLVNEHGLRYDPDYRGSSDYKFWIDALEFSDFYILDDYLLNYRRHGAQESTGQRTRQKRNHIKTTLFQLQKVISDISPKEVENLLFPKHLNFNEKFNILTLYQKLLQINEEKKLYNQKALRSIILDNIYYLLRFEPKRNFISILRFLKFKDIFLESSLLTKVVKKITLSNRNNLSPFYNAQVLYKKIVKKNILHCSIYGAGDISDSLLHIIHNDSECKVTIESVFDIKAESKSFMYQNFMVQSPSDINKINHKNIIIASYLFKEDIVIKLKSILKDDFYNYHLITL